MTAGPGSDSAPGGSTPPGHSGRAAASAGRGTAWRQAWRRWRHSRPFLGGLLVVAGGVEMLLSEKAPLPLIIHIGLQGLAGYLIPVVMVVCGLLLLFHPVQRTFYSILAVLLALGSWITSNLGGFFIGLLLGLIGGSLAFAWQQRGPGSPRKRWRRPRPSGEPSEGLALILGAPAPDVGMAGPAGGGQPGSGVKPDRDQPGTGASPDNAKGGPAARASPWRATAILGFPLTPLALSLLAGVVPAAPLPSAGVPSATLPAAPPSRPAPKPSASSQAPLPAPSKTARPAASPTASPSPLPSSPSPSPSPSATPAPQPTHRRPRHVAVAGPPAARASTARSELVAGSAVLTGLSFVGIAKVPTAAGVVPMLRLSMSSFVLSGGTMLVVTRAGDRSVTTDSSLEFSGNVLLYATRISGDMDGSQVTFTPKRPPSRHLAGLALARVVADQLYTSADSLYASGLRITEGSPGAAAPGNEEGGAPGP